jgi:ribosomal protein L11 methylase PrmA
MVEASGPAATSFRDPAGRVVLEPNRVLRFVNGDGWEGLQVALASARVAQLVEKGSLVSIRLDPEVGQHPQRTGRVVEHERIWFPSYPYEWCPEMLAAAGELTLEIAAAALEDSLTLKDASAYNVLFRGQRPVFVDWLSFEPRRTDDPLWLAEAQFSRHFLLPLLASKHFGIPPRQVFLVQRDGLEPAQLWKLSGVRQRLSPAFFWFVTGPTLLSKRAHGSGTGLYKRAPSVQPEAASFVYRRTLARLRRALAAARPRSPGDSGWARYMQPAPETYARADFESKERFVLGALEQHRPASVLDVGCNTGHFALMANRLGAEVVAIDSDSSVIATLWRAVAARPVALLPLVVDIGRPSPAAGWRCREHLSFLERARGRFEMVLMLAVLHHLVVGEGIALAEVLDLLHELTARVAVVELVESSDPAASLIARGRTARLAELTQTAFESVLARRFRILKRERVGQSHRWLYVLEKD